MMLPRVTGLRFLLCIWNMEGTQGRDREVGDRRGPDSLKACGLSREWSGLLGVEERGVSGVGYPRCRNDEDRACLRQRKPFWPPVTRPVGKVRSIAL